MKNASSDCVPALFAPPSRFIAGIYGTEFQKVMPELDLPFGYYLALGLDWALHSPMLQTYCLWRRGLGSWIGRQHAADLRPQGADAWALIRFRAQAGLVGLGLIWFRRQAESAKRQVLEQVCGHPDARAWERVPQQAQNF